MTDPRRPALADAEPTDGPAVEPRPVPVTLVASDGAVVPGILWCPPSGGWHTAVALTHSRGDRRAAEACPPLAVAGLAVLAFAPRDIVDDDTGHRADVEIAVAHLRALGAEDVVLLGVPVPTAPTGPVLVSDPAPDMAAVDTRTDQRRGRGRVLGVATGVGVAVGIGLAVATGVLVWPVLGAVAGIGVGDLVAGGRR
jgi:hypothetical protein